MFIHLDTIPALIGWTELVKPHGALHHCTLTRDNSQQINASLRNMQDNTFLQRLNSAEKHQATFKYHQLAK